MIGEASSQGSKGLVKKVHEVGRISEMKMKMK